MMVKDVEPLGPHTLVIGTVPLLLRHVRSSVAEVLEAPYVRAATALGIPRGRLLWRHVLSDEYADAHRDGIHRVA